MLRSYQWFSAQWNHTCWSIWDESWEVSRKWNQDHWVLIPPSSHIGSSIKNPSIYTCFLWQIESSLWKKMKLKKIWRDETGRCEAICNIPNMCDCISNVYVHNILTSIHWRFKRSYFSFIQSKDILLLFIVLGVVYFIYKQKKNIKNINENICKLTKTFNLYFKCWQKKDILNSQETHLFVKYKQKDILDIG